HDHVELPGPDQLSGKRYRIQARQADLVNGQGWHGHRYAGGHRGLTSRDLSLAGLQYLAHDDVLDTVARNARALQRRLDSQPAELSSSEPAQRTEQAANRGSCPANDYCLTHS